jgi:probable rRNA maturation factor
MAKKLAPGRKLEISVSLVGAAEITRLNRDHLGHDEPTDVLSFPLMEPGELSRTTADRRGRPEPLGDIVICTDVAREQAAEAGLPLTDELRALAAHGLLHLMGYGHDEPSAAHEMARLESELVGRSIIEKTTGVC